MKFWRKKKVPAPISAPVPAAPDKESKGFTNGSSLFPGMNDAARYDVAMHRSFKRSHDQLKTVGVAMDGNIQTAMDSSIQQVKGLISQNQGFLPIHVLEWYSSQGFIGWQVCAILAQNWLVNKACKMPGQDAVRKGFERSANGGEKVPDGAFDKIRKFDKKFKLKSNLVEHYKFARVFGLRHTLFLVDGIDYEMPFNIDGVKKGSYRGMTQIDPYWIAPMFNAEDAADPASQNFYNPTWWMINGKKIHRSHFVISRNGNELPDILKPTYFYGGLSTVQLIYDRVYAAERTSNEAPLLAMTKRLITLTTDTTKAMGNLDAFKQKLTEWLAFLNNFGCKVVGADEKVEQIDTSLAGLMETIVTQYELVSAIADVPASKLMGTSPKGGIGDAGNYELKSYHEFLESVQEDELTPIVDRHTMLVQRSENIAPGINLETQWNPVDTPTAKEQSEINLNKANTDAAYVNAGVVLGEEVRKRVIEDRGSGYNGLEMDVELPLPEDDDGEPEGGGEDDNADPEKRNPATDAMVMDGRYDRLLERRGEAGWHPELGIYNGARIITHQKFLDPKIVAEKISAQDFLVHVTPEFVRDGKLYRMVVDGHHSLAAAMEAGAVPTFSEELPREVLINAATRQAADGITKI